MTAAAPAIIPDDIKALSFEASLAELERIVRQLEDGKIPLEEAVAAYERGSALKAHCEARLREAQLKIDRIALQPDGSVRLEPANLSN